ncbi:kinase-like domain-containing protein [Gigaspora rosea]|uniref:Kinase-like domain-containing protein n=1 Tax=Gigaspora rosea TaxID=44941 RepID=A0A397W8R3_9GLOM|nr:kinase-like domain-containing protein [Gigaspora rosea]
MKWEDKLTLLLCIISDLKEIHSKNIIHRDLHSGNILQDVLHCAYISDLGLSISVDIELKMESGRVYGILPYIDPEVLNGKAYTTASDIYSFGIIMWEILHGEPVFCDKKLDQQLQIQICFSDLRPKIEENMSGRYLSLMKECWGKKQEKRPTAVEIEEILTKWQNDEKVLLELSELENKLKNTSRQKYSEVLYESKFHLCTHLCTSNLMFNIIDGDEIL